MRVGSAWPGVPAMIARRRICCSMSAASAMSSKRPCRLSIPCRPWVSRSRLLTHLVVREDAHVLYGFAHLEERALFRSLLKVSGVGPKIALAILSGISAEAFAHACEAEDVATLTRIPGVGRKIAERLIIEMRDRLAEAEQLSRQPRRRRAAEPVGTARRRGLRCAGGAGLQAGRGHAPAQVAGPMPAALSTEELIRRALQGAVRE